MKRKEEIEKAAMQVSGVHPDWSNLECFRMGFREGAKFVDKTMLDRACEWLRNRHNIEKCLGILTSRTEDLSKAFRQAMEGGAE